MVYTTKYEDIFFYNIRGREKVIYILKKQTHMKFL